MRNLIFAMAMLTAVPALAAGGAGPSGGDAALNSTLQAEFSAIADGFNKGDPAAVVSHFGDDVHMYAPDGAEATGRAEVSKKVTEHMNTMFKGSSDHRITVDAVRSISPSAAFVDTTHTASNVRGPEGKTGDLRLHGVFLLRRTDGAWKVVELRPYRFAPPARLGAVSAAAPATGR